MNTSRPSPVRRRQRGITLFGLLFWAIIVAVVAVVIMKVFPAVNEYLAIKTVVNQVAKSGASSVAEVRADFDQRKSVAYGIEISSRDLEITKEDDKIVISFAYDREIELMDPVYLLLKFKGQSK